MTTLMTTNGTNFLVDDEDVQLVTGYSWWSFRTYKSDYVCAGSNPRIYIHRFIMGVTSPSVEVDHKNGNGLDNQRMNLRVVTHQKNLANQRPKKGTSSYKGVHLDKKRQLWVANIAIDGHTKYLGGFHNEQDAASAYDAAALQAWGEYAWLNFPKEMT